MPPALVPCPSCRRHVRATEESCPFCRNALPESPVIVPGTTQRLTRAAAYAFATTLAATGVAGCSGGTEPTPNPSEDGGSQQPVYGAPEYGAPAVDAGQDTGATGALYGGAPEYGAPPIDAGKD